MSQPTKKTFHVSRSLHIVKLVGERIWRTFNQRSGIDPDDASRPVWVQIATMTDFDAKAYIESVKALRTLKRAA